MERKRIDYLNYLKVLATLGVIIIHLIGEFWVNTNTRSFGWNVANFFESLTRGSVPIFVMISGALFLSRDLSIEKLYINIYSDWWLPMSCGQLFMRWLFQ